MGTNPPSLPALSREEVVALIRTELPKLLREDEPLRHEMLGLLAESVVTRGEVTALLEEIRGHREETRTHFEAMQEQMDRRFEATERRFEAMQEQMDRRFDEARQHREELRRFIEDLRRWMEVTVGGLQNRAGRNLEDLVAGTLRLALGLTDIEPEHVRLRQTIEDTHGRIGPRGRRYEYDILAIDGQAVVFEVKSTPDPEDVERFADKAELVAGALGRPVRSVLLTLGRRDDVVEACRRRGVELTS
jgi:hypothetical protein